MPSGTGRASHQSGFWNDRVGLAHRVVAGQLQVGQAAPSMSVTQVLASSWPWPSPVNVTSRAFGPSSPIIFCAQRIGVAGSLVPPTTTIGPSPVYDTSTGSTVADQLGAVVALRRQIVGGDVLAEARRGGAERRGQRLRIVGNRVARYRSRTR